VSGRELLISARLVTTRTFLGPNFKISIAVTLDDSNGCFNECIGDICYQLTDQRGMRSVVSYNPVFRELRLAPRLGLGPWVSPGLVNARAFLRSDLSVRPKINECIGLLFAAEASLPFAGDPGTIWRLRRFTNDWQFYESSGEKVLGSLRLR
jgi:hypothetical protein